MNANRYLIACFLSGISGALLMWLCLDRPTPLTARAQDRGAVNPLPALPQFSPEELINIRVYEKTNQSVVNITTRIPRVDSFFGLEPPAEGAGSGSVLDHAGHVLTNHHVIDGAQQINVTLFNGTTYPAQLIGADPVYDMAVLKIAAPPDVLIPIEMGDSTGLKVGQRVFALGNPFGLERTLTAGIISSLNRSLPSRTGRTMKSIIQVDAALNQGNSGGPLMDTRGRLIGMNTAIASSTGENTGVGFAIPVNTIRRAVPQLIEKGRVIRPDIGITRVYQTEEGLVIATLAAGGPAERAGLRGFRLVRRERRRGPFIYEETTIDRAYADRILAVEGKPVRTADELLTIIDQKHPGDEVVVTVARENQQIDIRVVLGAGE